MLRESRRRRALSSREDADDMDGGGERARRSGGSNNGIRGETRRPTNVVHVANISSRITGHHVREIFNAYQLNAKRREGDHGDDEGGGIENVTFGPGRAFCRVQFREVEDAEYARENLDGGEIDGKKIKVVFVDSASCGEEKKGYRNAHANNTFHANNSNTYGRGESGTSRGRREFGNRTMTTNGTHRQQHYGGGRRSRSRSPPPRRDSGTYRGRDRGRRRGYSRSRSRSPPLAF